MPARKTKSEAYMEKYLLIINNNARKNKSKTVTDLLDLNKRRINGTHQN